MSRQTSKTPDKPASGRSRLFSTRSKQDGDDDGVVPAPPSSRTSEITPRLGPELENLDVDGITDRVTHRIAAAMENAQRKQRDADAQLSETYRQLDEQSEDELLSIDFRALPNNFKILEEELASIKFQMPRRWTKKYAASLKDDTDRVKRYPDPAVTQPVFTVENTSGRATPRLVDTERGVVKHGYAYERPTKSFDDLERTESRNERHDFLSPGFMRGKFPNRAASVDVTTGSQDAYKESTYLEGAISSHIGLTERSLTDFQDQCKRDRVCIVPSDRIREADKKMDDFYEYLQLTAIRDFDGLPKIADQKASKSKKHVSVSTQAGKRNKSAFQVHVEMKRNSSTGGDQDDNENHYKHVRRYQFLKDLPIDHYMASKKDSANRKFDSRVQFGPLSPGQLTHNISLQKKPKQALLPTYKKKAAHASTQLPSPHSLPDVNQSSNDIESGKVTKKKMVVKNPTLIVPVGMGQRRPLVQTQSQESRKCPSVGENLSISQSRHDHCSRTRCTGSILQMVNSCEPFSRYRFADSNPSFHEVESTESFQRGWNGKSLTLNTIVNSAAHVLKQQTDVLARTQSRKHVGNAIEHHKQRLGMPMSSMLMRQYLSEASFSCKFKSPEPDSKPKLTYKSSEPLQVHKPIVVPRHGQEKNENQDTRTHIKRYGMPNKQLNINY